MSTTTTSKEGWISVPIASKFEKKAKEMRAQRDQQYGNIYREAHTDERWVGDLGEMAFNSWLRHNHIQDFQWIINDAAGQPDFMLPNGIRIGVKTVKRQGAPIMHPRSRTS